MAPMQFDPAGSGKLKLPGLRVPSTASGPTTPVVTGNPGALPSVSSAPAGVFGTRLGVTGYAGPALRVQKSSADTTQLDIPFLASGLIDVSAVLGFTGATVLDGTLVALVYNQDGSGNNAYQATAANMPVLSTDAEGQPVIFYPVSTYLSFDTSINTSTASVFYLGRYDGGSIVQFGTTSLSLQGSTIAGGKLAFGTATSRTSTVSPYQNTSVIGMVSSAAALKLSQDSSVATTSSPATSNAVVQLRIGNSTSANTTMAGQMQLVAVYPAALSDTDATSVRSALMSSRSIGAKTRSLVITEDSLSAGTGATFQRDRVHWMLADSAVRSAVRIYQRGKGGRQLSVAATDYSTDVSPCFDSAAGAINVIALLGGINDAANSQTASQIQTSLQNYSSSAKSTGFKLALYRIPVAPPNNAAMTDFNTWLAANWATYGDAYIDLRQTSIGTGSGGANNTYYSDATHPNSLGYQIWAAYELANGLKTLLGV